VRLSKPHWHRGRLRCRIDGEEIYLADRRRPEEFPSPATYERAAIREYHRRMAGRRELSGDVGAVPASVAGLIARWKKLHRSDDASYRLAPLLKHAGHHLLDKLPMDLLDSYLAHLREWVYERQRGKDSKGRKRKPTQHHLSERSIRDRYSLAVAVLRDAVNKGWVERMPTITKLGKVAANPRGLPPETVAGLLAELPDHARTLCEFVDAVGCRTDEAMRLRWEWVRRDTDGTPRTIVFGDHKSRADTGEVKTLYVTPAAAQILNAIQQARTGPIFLNSRGRPYAYSGIRSILRRASKRLGIEPPVTPHQLRHSFAQRQQKQLPVQVLSKLLGHRDVAQTARYYYVEDEQALEAARSLASSTQAASPERPADARPEKPTRKDTRKGQTTRKSARGGSAPKRAVRRRA